MEVPVDRPVSPAQNKRTVSSLPGPTAWPLVGNLPQVDPERMHVTLENWVDKYGPLYRFQMGRRQTLVVARKDLIAQMLRDRPDGWKRLQSMQEIIREMGAHGLFSAEGDDWRRQASSLHELSFRLHRQRGAWIENPLSVTTRPR